VVAPFHDNVPYGFGGMFPRSANALDLKKTSSDLVRLDPALRIRQPTENIIVLHPILVDQILPSLTPAEIMGSATILQIPTDLLRVAQSLFFRRTLYSQTTCLLLRTMNATSAKYYFVIVGLSADRQHIERIMDRREIYCGTWDKLLNMNARFPGKGQEKLVSFRQLEAAFQNEVSIQNIKTGIARQSQSQVAELGGFLTIEHDPEGPATLSLHFVQSEGEDFVRQYKETMADWKKLVELMQHHPAEFALMAHQYRACLKTMELKISEEKKKKRVLDFAELYLFMAKNTFCPDIVRYLTLLSDESVRGLYVADFHIHPQNNEVSFQDKENSKDQRVLVIIPREAGFDLVDMINVDPYSQPLNVIRYRPDDAN